MKKISVLFILATWAIIASAQVDIGIGLQIYPTGLIPNIHAEFGISQKGNLQTRVGYNIVRHRDLGEHQDERGGGFGGSLGYRHYFNATKLGFLFGIKTDLWWNEVDWRDNVGLIIEENGTTNVTVLQPTAEIGYAIHLKEDDLIITPTLALGAEINIKTEGSEVGQGAILLIGVTISKRFL